MASQPTATAHTQEAILTIPRGITRLMDMLMDREVIRNEALLLLTHLTCEAEEIQKIVVFEGAFEKTFSIIKEDGGSEGGVVVQDCLELLNNLIRNTVSNQVLPRETIGFDHLTSILKLRGNMYSFTQQKVRATLEKHFGTCGEIIRVLFLQIVTLVMLKGTW